MMLLRIASTVVVAAIVTLPVLIWIGLEPREERMTWSDFLQGFEALVASTVFLGAAIVFLVSIERRAKRNRALEALHELRSLAHVVDMHQLTKDPELVLAAGKPTASSPGRPMTRFELLRYLDYCTEMLSLMSKVAALYVQELKDPVVLDNVDAVEALTTGLARKIWQKIMLIGTKAGTQPEAGGRPDGAAEEVAEVPVRGDGSDAAGVTAL
jgi:hypothetical protein